MRTTFLFLAIAGLIASCSNETKEETKSSEPVKASVPLPYTASYSSSFEMGNPEYSAMILQGSWKDWEENKLDKSKWLADTVVAFHSDNTMTIGADSLIARWSRMRGTYTSVIDTVHAVIPTYSTDKKENWVLVWAKEINAKADGTKDTTELMETWRINKDGKADLLLQYDRAKRKQ